MPLELPGPWPDLPLAAWRGTRDALHLWMQVVGKSLLARCPPQNHWWHAALRVTARGLATAAPLIEGQGELDVEFDLVGQALVVRSEGRSLSMPLAPRSVHAVLEEYQSMLRQLGFEPHIWPVPVEIPGAIPLDRDDAVRPYDPAAARRFWEVLRRCDAALRALVDGWVGKQSPVHFFWGSFDLAYTRFSGRRAPPRAGFDAIMREAYSHEVISFGFWPGGISATGVELDEPVIYAYAAPEPEGFAEAPVSAPHARYDRRLGEWVLPYERICGTAEPARAIREFCEQVYVSGATLARWPRAELERRDPWASEAGAPSQPGV